MGIAELHESCPGSESGDEPESGKRPGGRRTHPTPGGESARTEYSGPVGVTTFRFGGQAVRLVPSGGPGPAARGPRRARLEPPGRLHAVLGLSLAGGLFVAEAVVREESIGGIAPDGARTHESGECRPIREGEPSRRAGMRKRLGRSLALPRTGHHLSDVAQESTLPGSPRCARLLARRRAPDGARRAPYEDAGAGARRAGRLPRSRPWRSAAGWAWLVWSRCAGAAGAVQRLRSAPLDFVVRSAAENGFDAGRYTTRLLNCQAAG